MEAVFCGRVSGAASADLEILETVNEIEVLRLRAAPDPRNCQRNRASEASRSSRSSKLSMKSRFRGLAELQVIENVDDIELRRPRGAPSRALNADTGARWGALASISKESRSSRSSKISTKATFGGFEELQVGNSTRTRERDGGLQPPIERLVYIYILLVFLVPSTLAKRCHASCDTPQEWKHSRHRGQKRCHASCDTPQGWVAVFVIL